ncbi:MAG: histidine kinase [Bacteroidota bacterium]
MKRPERHIYIVSTIVALALPLFFNLRLYFHNQEINLVYIVGGVTYSFLETFSIFYFTSIVTDFLQNKFPWQKNLIKRILIEFGLMTIISSVLTAINFELYLYLFNDYVPCGFEMNLFDNIVLAILMCLIIGSIDESIYVVNQWKSAIVETERLKRENIESQFSALKNQINPHFLFNSLNTLSSLINISPDKAVEFVNKFSKIYRYVLEVKDKSLVELRVELEFIKSFNFLQKIRYGENLIFEIMIDEDLNSRYIPPLTLQLLIENAVKHNEISDQFPLKIFIYTENDFLFVMNSLKIKNVDIYSTGIGLNNLKERYAHFSDKHPEFYSENGNYYAKIPLLKDEE